MKIRCGLRSSGMLGAVGLYLVQNTRTNLRHVTSQKSENLKYNLTEALNRATPDVSAASDQYLARRISVAVRLGSELPVCGCLCKYVYPTLKLIKYLKDFTRLATGIIPLEQTPAPYHFI
jgi:hypothetical protein